MRYFFSSIAICMLFVLGIALLRPDGITAPSYRAGIEAATTNMHAGTWAACTEVNSECGDHTLWSAWPDVDHNAGLEVLHCARLHPGAGGRSRYEMDGPQGLASHTEIAMWFSLSDTGKRLFAQSCGK